MDALRTLIDREDADMFVLSGPLYWPAADAFIRMVDDIGTDRRGTAGLILCTFGGDADAAYRLCRAVQSCYERLVLYVFGYCKSAGTIVALGADEIIMSMFGEFGPLDVQLQREDELVSRTSGLDLSKALRSLSDQAFSIWEQHFMEIQQRSGGAITTRTAADIATAMAVGMVQPVLAQIDPVRIGEVERTMAIAEEYGRRLGTSGEVVHQLVQDYPSHGFVIDWKEAAALFPSVRLVDDLERAVERTLADYAAASDFPSVRIPTSEYSVLHLTPPKETQSDEEKTESPAPDETPGTARRGARANQDGRGPRGRGGSKAVQGVDAEVVPPQAPAENGDRGD